MSPTAVTPGDLLLVHPIRAPSSGPSSDDVSSSISAGCSSVISSTDWEGSGRSLTSWLIPTRAGTAASWRTSRESPQTHELEEEFLPRAQLVSLARRQRWGVPSSPLDGAG